MIERKLKTCKSCGKPSYLWSGGMCKPCKMAEKPQTASRKKPSKRVNPMSKVLKSKLEKYRLLRVEYLSVHPVCQACKTERAVQIHHKKGRDGNNLFDHFLAVCDNCHKRIEANPAWARENGYTLSRLN